LDTFEKAKEWLNQQAIGGRKKAFKLNGLECPVKYKINPKSKTVHLLWIMDRTSLVNAIDWVGPALAEELI
jgi:hypothetical protein